jgi:hypothetical protein
MTRRRRALQRTRNPPVIPVARATPNGPETPLCQAVSAGGEGTSDDPSSNDGGDRCGGPRGRIYGTGGSVSAPAHTTLPDRAGGAHPGFRPPDRAGSAPRRACLPGHGGHAGDGPGPARFRRPGRRAGGEQPGARRCDRKRVRRRCRNGVRAALAAAYRCDVRLGAGDGGQGHDRRGRGPRPDAGLPDEVRGIPDRRESAYLRRCSSTSTSSPRS